MVESFEEPARQVCRTPCAERWRIRSLDDHPATRRPRPARARRAARRPGILRPGGADQPRPAGLHQRALAGGAGTPPARDGVHLRADRIRTFELPGGGPPALRPRRPLGGTARAEFLRLDRQRRAWREADLGLRGPLRRGQGPAQRRGREAPPPRRPGAGPARPDHRPRGQPRADQRRLAAHGHPRPPLGPARQLVAREQPGLLPCRGRRPTVRPALRQRLGRFPGQ